VLASSAGCRHHVSFESTLGDRAHALCPFQCCEGQAQCVYHRHHYFYSWLLSQHSSSRKHLRRIRADTRFVLNPMWQSLAFTYLHRISAESDRRIDGYGAMIDTVDRTYSLVADDAISICIIHDPCWSPSMMTIQFTEAQKTHLHTSSLPPDLRAFSEEVRRQKQNNLRFPSNLSVPWTL